MQQNNLNNLIINKMTQAQYDTITPASDELYFITDGVLQSSDVINALGYTPVNKAGDIMTGNLAVLNGTPRFYLRDENEVAGTSPSSKITKQLNFQDNNSTLVGYVGNSYLTTGERYTVIASKDASGNNGAEIRVGYDSNGNVYTYAPTPASTSNGTNIATTAFCDGNWTASGKQVLNNAGLNGSTDLTFDLTTYLPNTTDLYEILVTANCKTGTTAGNSIAVIASLGGYPIDIYLCSARTTANGESHGSGSCMITVKRTDTFKIKKSTSYNGSCNLWFAKYRKVR